MKSFTVGNFIANCDEKGFIVNFEAVKGAQINAVAWDIIRYLTIREDKNEYALIFNDKELKISWLSSPPEIAEQYFTSNYLNV